MADSTYNREHLGAYAAGFINGAGGSIRAFGCELTRISTGHYALLLGENTGLVDDESFTRVQVKGLTTRTATVVDTSNRVKTIFTQDETPALADTDIEVALFRSIVMG